MCIRDSHKIARLGKVLSEEWVVRITELGVQQAEDVLQRQLVQKRHEKRKEIFTAVTPNNPSISGLPHDRRSSVARQQRKKPDPRPPQAAGALKIALLGAHALLALLARWISHPLIRLRGACDVPGLTMPAH